jgi:hypothetical protein
MQLESFFHIVFRGFCRATFVLAGGVLTLVGPLASSRPTQIPSLP